MPPRMVLCSCDPEWTALAVCEECERRELHTLLLKRGHVENNPLERAWDELVASFERSAS